MIIDPKEHDSARKKDLSEAQKRYETAIRDARDRIEGKANIVPYVAPEKSTEREANFRHEGKDILACFDQYTDLKKTLKGTMLYNHLRNHCADPRHNEQYERVMYLSLKILPIEESNKIVAKYVAKFQAEKAKGETQNLSGLDLAVNE